MSNLLPFDADKVHLEELPILDIRDLVAWKKSRRVYNFEKLPATAILSIFSLPKQGFRFWNTKKLKGITGQNYLLKKENCLFCSASTNGAPAIVMLCEELRALGVERFIFIGLGAAMNQQLKEGDITWVKKAYAGTGTNYYYDEKKYAAIQRNAITSEQIAAANLNITPCTVWSTDAPFRETRRLRDYYKQLGAEIVEMETAAIYAFANYYQLEASCFLVVSDQLLDQWSPPVNIQLVQQQFIRIFNFIKEQISSIS